MSEVDILIKANTLLRDGAYKECINYYKEYLKFAPQNYSHIETNLTIALERLAPSQLVERESND